MINKSYNSARDIYTPEEYLKNFNWIYFWFKRNFVEILEHFLTIIFQTVVAFMAGILVTFTIWKNKIINIVKKIFKKKK